MGELDGLIAEIEADEETRAVILTGAGRGFCLGGDLKALFDPAAKPLLLGQRYTFLNRLEDMGQPVIAAVNGPYNAVWS